MARLETPAFALLAAVCTALTWGCASPRVTGPVAIAPEQYGATFDAARDVLRERRFDLARVDSTSGVLTTMPSVSAGLFTPWSRDQQTLDDELDDTLNRQQRTVRIDFEPLDPPAEGGGAAGTPRDLVAHPVPTRLEVRVTVERRHRAGQQPQPASITMNSRWYDPALDRRGLREYNVSVRRDEALEHVLLDEILERAGVPVVPVETAPEPSKASPGEAATHSDGPAPAAEPSRP